MSSNSYDYVAYTIYIGITTYVLCVLASCNTYELFNEFWNPKQSHKLDSGATSRLALLFFRFALLGAPIYFYIYAGTEIFGDGNGRNPALATSLAIAQIIFFLNYVHNVYFYAHRKEIHKVTWNPVHNSNGDIIDHDRDWFISWSKAMYAVNALGFMSFVILDPIYLFTSDGWHTDLASTLLLTGSIILAVSTLMVFAVFNLNEHKKTMQSLRYLLQRGKECDTKRELNYDHNHELLNVTPLGKLLHEKGVELNPNDALSTSVIPEYRLLGGIQVDINSRDGKLLNKAAAHFNDDRVAIRQLDNRIYGMKAEDAVVADEYMNTSMGGILKLPTIVSTTKRLYGKLSKYNRHMVDGRGVEESAGDTLLNPKLLPSSSEKANDDTFDHGYVTATLNYDAIGAGYFPYTQDVWGLTSGIGFYFNLTGAIVMIYTILKLGYYIYFISDTKYGIIIWLVTTWLPLHATMESPAMFWDAHLQAHLVGWFAITIANAVTPSTQFTYIYSNDVWNNTEISDTICFGSCTDLDDSYTYYTIAMFAFIVSILVFFSIFVVTLAKCGVFNNQ